MLISTKGRYALRVMLDLAEHAREDRVPMKDVAARQQISLKYLEQILPRLTKSGMVEGVHGKGGGYRLTRAPEDYSIGEILRLTEGDLAPVSCLECTAPACPRMEGCRTRPLWEGLDKVVNTYLNSFTLADLADNQQGKYL